MTGTLRSRLLVVDDSPANLRLLGAALRDDFHVRVATNGTDALRITGEDPPDLILLDVVMPEPDGYEICRRLKAAPETRDIPVIFLTSRDEVEDITRGLELGAVDYITKPPCLPIVRARIRTHLDLKHHRDQLERLATLDGMTGIGNRRQLDRMLEQQWQRAIRQGTTLAALLADIDHFKAYNDTFGHLAGDDCIRRVAGAFADQLGERADLLARFGGEEYVVLLPGVDPAVALSTAEQLRAAVAALGPPEGEPGRAVTVSIGVATLRPTPGSPAGELLRLADRAMYRAKEAGRNRVASA